jgi:hypothetical protein
MELAQVVFFFEEYAQVVSIDSVGGHADLLPCSWSLTLSSLRSRSYKAAKCQVPTQKVETRIWHVKMRSKQRFPRPLGIAERDRAANSWLRAIDLRSTDGDRTPAGHTAAAAAQANHRGGGTQAPAALVMGNVSGLG